MFKDKCKKRLSRKNDITKIKFKGKDDTIS